MKETFEALASMMCDAVIEKLDKESIVKLVAMGLIAFVAVEKN